MTNGQQFSENNVKRNTSTGRFEVKMHAEAGNVQLTAAKPAEAEAALDERDLLGRLTREDLLRTRERIAQAERAGETPIERHRRRMAESLASNFEMMVNHSVSAGDAQDAVLADSVRRETAIRESQRHEEVPAPEAPRRGFWSRLTSFGRR